MQERKEQIFRSNKILWSLYFKKRRQQGKRNANYKEAKSPSLSNFTDMQFHGKENQYLKTVVAKVMTEQSPKTGNLIVSHPIQRFRDRYSDTIVAT